MTQTVFPNPFKESLEIKRYPFRENDQLQAFDSADELILSHLTNIDLTNKKILIINDEFGALALSLQDFKPLSYTDSFLSFQGTLKNGHGKITPIHDLANLTGEFDLVLLRLPKNLSFLEDILAKLTHHLNSNSEIICAEMVKHLSKGSFDLLQKYIGETSTSLAKKKARLIFCKFTKEKVQSSFPITLKVENFKLPFINHSNLFSREKLDIGTRFFLEHIPQGDYKKILDLGCANGIVGIRAKELNPTAKIFFSDESYMAIISAEINFKNHIGEEAEFFWTNCFEHQSKNELDLILCNPPFHQQTTVGDFIALQMFQDSFAALRPGGKLVVIGNSHLAYQVKLKKIFGNSKIVATNSKFMIVEARRT